MAKGKVLLGELAEPVKLVDGTTALNRVLGDYKEGVMVLVETEQDGYCVLRQRDLAGYPSTRLLEDLPLDPVLEMDEMATALQALDAIQGCGAPGTVVRTKDGGIGYVSKERLIEIAMEAAFAAEREASLLASIHEAISSRQSTGSFQEVMDLLCKAMGSGTAALVSRTGGTYCLEALGSDSRGTIMTDLITVPLSEKCRTLGLNQKLVECMEKTLQRGKGYYSDDLENRCMFRDSPCRRAGASWCMIHPLVRKNGDAALVWLLGSDRAGLSTESKELLEGLSPALGASFLAALYERDVEDMNRTLQEKVRQRTFELEVLYEMARKIGTALHYDDLFANVALGLRSVMKHDLLLTIVYTDGIKELISYPRRPLARSLLHEMEKRLIEEFNARGGLRIREEDLNRPDSTSHWKYEDDGYVDRLDSIILVPLHVGGDDELVGMMLVAASEPDAFDEQQVKLLHAVIQQASVSVEKLRVLVKKQHRRLESLIEHLPDAVALLDKAGCVLASNKLARDYLGDIVDWIGRNEIGRLCGTTIDEVVERTRKFGGLECNLGIEGEGKEQRVFQCRAFEFAEHVYDDDFEKGYVLVVSDITKEKEMERQAAVQQRLAAIGELAGGVAHDFNNLLTVILAITEMASAELDEDNQVYDDLRQIREAAQKASGLTRQLLAFSRRQVLKSVALDMNELIANLKKMLQRLIGENINLETELSDDLPPVKVDPGLMEQVIINLAVNARDAMPDGGILTIKTGKIDLEHGLSSTYMQVKPGSYVTIEVSDTGVGMDKATMTRIFEPFFTTKERGKGTGLGLSMVYGILKQSQGYVEVESEPGKGTTFRLLLPKTEARPGYYPARDKVKEERSLSGDETILLVEDDKSVRKLTARLLKGAGYNVLEAGDGIEALTLEERYEGTIDMVLTDMVMPGPNGREVVSEILSRRPEVRVMFMSGYTDDEIFRKGVDQTRWSFIQKPFDAKELLNAVRAVLDGE